MTESVLIQRASAAVARAAMGVLGGAYGRRVVVIAGKGHNGADALWAGVRLAERGARVDVVLPAGEPADAHGQEPLNRLRGRGARVVVPTGAKEVMAAADLVLDGLLGTGARIGAASVFPWSGMREQLAAARAPVVAVDVPSGVDADTGAADSDAPAASVTVTFGAAKVGLVTGAGKALAGVVVVADIGLGPRTGWTGYPMHHDTAMLDADDVAELLDIPDRTSSKYTRGVVGIVAGSADYPGAALLACAGALGAGAGMVRLFAPRPVRDLVHVGYPEVVGHDLPAALDDLPRLDRWVLGPGLGGGPAAGDVVRLLLADSRPMVLDADALSHAGMAGIRGRAGPTLITPHAGEMSRLIGVAGDDIRRDPLGVARRAAAELACTVLLKGDGTVIADSAGTARINPTATAWLASAGTGDVLAGMCGALWREDVETAAAGPWLHGLAGRLAAGGPGAPLTASELARSIPAAIRLARGDAPQRAGNGG